MKPGKIQALALVSTAILIPASLRHHLVWGGEQYQLLHNLEWLCLMLFTAGSCYALHQACQGIRSGEIDLRWIWKGAILLALLCFLAPPFLTEDVFGYVARGSLMALHGGNPYVDMISDFPELDRDIRHLVKDWADFPLPYGPLLAYLFAGIAWVAEQFSFLDLAGRLWLATYLFKILNIGAFLLGGLFVSRLAAARGPKVQAMALLFYLYNPFCLLEFGVNAHNDVFLTTPLLWAIYEASRLHHGRAGLALLLSSLGKFTSLALGPFFLVLAWRHKALRPFALAMLVGALAYALCFLIFWSGPEGLSWFSRQGGIPGGSLQRLARLALGGSRDLWKVIGICLFMLWLLSRLHRIRDLQSLSLESAILLSFLVLLVLPASSPWYQLWWLPLAFIAGRQIPALTLALLIGPSYSIYLLTRTLGPEHQWLTWSLTIALPTLLLFIPSSRQEEATPQDPA